jgi:hypothetical protein
LGLGILPFFGKIVHLHFFLLSLIAKILYFEYGLYFKRAVYNVFWISEGGTASLLHQAQLFIGMSCNLSPPHTYAHTYPAAGDYVERAAHISQMGRLPKEMIAP